MKVKSFLTRTLNGYCEIILLIQKYLIRSCSIYNPKRALNTQISSTNNLAKLLAKIGVIGVGVIELPEMLSQKKQPAKPTQEPEKQPEPAPEQQQKEPEINL